VILYSSPRLQSLLQCLSGDDDDDDDDDDDNISSQKGFQPHFKVFLK
jgi:hypothetical protein